MQHHNKRGVFYFWTHCWYFGSDFTFGVICMQQWLEIGWWFWIALAVGNMMFMVVELWSLAQCVKYERQEIFGRYTNGRPVTESYAWKRAILCYLIGIVIFAGMRAIIGDPMVMFLFFTTNAVVAITVPLRFEELGRYEPGMKYLSISNLFDMIFATAPIGIGYYTTMVNALSTPWFYAIGLVSIGFTIWGIYLAWVKLPKYGTFENPKDPNALEQAAA